MATNPEKKLVSLVVPVLNEELNIQPFYDAVTPVIARCSDRYDFELIFTDNHSTDATFENLRRLAAADPRVRVLRFSRNFGYQRSILTGYLSSSGDAVIQLDCDLQDPPELIVDFLRHWEEGHAVVYGIRRSRRDNPMLHAVRKLFYRAINYLSDDQLPVDAGDFRLIDKRVVAVLRRIDDAQPYLRGTIATIGFRQLGVPYDRRGRERGSSNFRFKDLIALALDGILNHSIVPLRLASLFGVVTFAATFVAMFAFAIGKLFFGLAWPAGFATLAIIGMFGISVNALFFGIIGEYLGRIYQQVKKKPITIIEAELGFPDAHGETARSLDGERREPERVA